MFVKKKSLNSYILLALEKAVDGYVRLEDLGHRSYRYTYGYPAVPTSQLSQAIKRLREKGFIKQDKINMGEVVLKLTDQGRDALGIEDNAEQWDGKWRIVIWDIPEQKRIIRNLFRRNLKKWGFKHLQNSVWISKRNVYQKLMDYVKNLGIEQWVTVIEAEKLSSNHNL